MSENKIGKSLMMIMILLITISAPQITGEVFAEESGDEEDPLGDAGLTLIAVSYTHLTLPTKA